MKKSKKCALSQKTKLHFLPMWMHTHKKCNETKIMWQHFSLCKATHCSQAFSGTQYAKWFLAIAANDGESGVIVNALVVFGFHLIPGHVGVSVQF